MSKFDELLSRLSKVRKGSNGNYMACCPAHEDRAASLAIKEGNDGAILINCFAGCGAHEVLDALGVTWSDLYPPKTSTGKRQRLRVPFNEAIRTLEMEAAIVWQYAKMIENKEGVDSKKLLDAIERIEILRNLTE
jgi:hypothetical protein